MAIAAATPRGDVTASLNFYHPPAEKGAVPFNAVDPYEGQPDRNFSDESHATLIHDVRGREADFTLDRDAFQVIQDVPPSREASFTDDESIKANYYPEVEALLLSSIAGSNRVHIFDHTVRRAFADATRKPVSRVHIDQTVKSVAQRVRHYFSEEESEKLLAGRYRIVNVWRPLTKGPVESFPLGFASSASLGEDDVVPIEHRYRSGYTGQTAAIRHNPAQKWYYLSGMTGSERLLLECFDSESLKDGSGIGGRVPHSAFEDPRTRQDAEPRQSIEVRALVFGP